MKRVFLYEYLSAGGLVDGDEAATNELLAMGLAMRSALEADLRQVEDVVLTVACSARTPPPSTDAATALPMLGETPWQFVARQADGHDFTWVVAPETGGLLERISRGVDPARWIGCDADAIHLTTGKRATLKRLSEQGVATPLAFEHWPEIDRWVVKPDDGAGAVATRLHTSQDEAWDDWAQRSRQGMAMSLEPWVVGEPMSLSLLCSEEGAEVLSVNRQHILVDGDGVVRYEGVKPHIMSQADPRMRTLRTMASQVARHIPGLRGFVGVDLVWHPQCGPVLIEVNPRVTCAYVGLSRALGRHLAADIIVAHQHDHRDAHARH
ncbi:ATP-grasp domain-containing protein [Ideonella sp. DXS29W]|uniref:ATP-grasp domain-containing protein n=1 Tax=Ideonella lacteola TaxID=2984193 RepID=A0ABU9BIB8_9BURK